MFTITWNWGNFASSLKTAAPTHLFLADLEEKSALFDQAAIKYSAKVAGWVWLNLVFKEENKIQDAIATFIKLILMNGPTRDYQWS